MGRDTVSSSGNSVAANRKVWNEWDWSQLGEEWTEEVAGLRGLDPQAWKHEILKRFLLAHARAGGTSLEIGPGAGRWTETLIEISELVHVADIAPRCLELCRQRFGASEKLRCHLVRAVALEFLDDCSIDFITR